MKQYLLDVRFIDHGQMLADGWKLITDELPPTTSYRAVLLVMNKHDKSDAHVVSGGWYPTDNYKKGHFSVYKDLSKVEKNKILYWRDLCMIKTTQKKL